MDHPCSSSQQYVIHSTNQLTSPDLFHTTHILAYACDVHPVQSAHRMAGVPPTLLQCPLKMYCQTAVASCLVHAHCKLRTLPSTYLLLLPSTGASCTFCLASACCHSLQPMPAARSAQQLFASCTFCPANGCRLRVLQGKWLPAAVPA
jgi:hypothetical protein